MEEKKLIDYSRTYRRIKADKTSCAVYVIFLIVLAVLLVWLFIGDLTGVVSNFCKIILEKYAPSIRVSIKSETYPFLRTIHYISVSTVYPTMQISFMNAGCALAVELFCACMPWRGRPLGIYLIMSGTVHLINSLWFVFAGDYFPYTLTVYSKLYIFQEIGIWIMFFVMTVCVTGIVGNRGLVCKLATLCAVMVYSIVFGAVRYVVFLYLLHRFSMIYMALFYFMLGPMFDFLYLVMLYAVFVNRMIRIYDARKGRGDWEWS